MSLVLFVTENKNAVRVLDELLKEYLIDINVILVSNVSSAIDSVTNEQRLSTIVIDQNFMQEVENIKLLRQKDVNFPIIAITDNILENEEDLIEAGATKVIEKPFYFKDFEPFLYALVNNYDSCLKGCFSLGEIDFYPANRSLYKSASDSIVNLTEKETDILKYLYRYRGQFIEKERLLEKIWSYSSQDILTHTLETHIYRLRGKLEELTMENIIITENGKYKLV